MTLRSLCPSAAFVVTVVSSAMASGQEMVRHESLPLESSKLSVGAPIYSVGSVDGDVVFSRVFMGVIRDDSTAVVVNSGGSQELYFLGTDGRVVAVRGGSGQGPGEFVRITSLARLGKDTVVVEDDGNSKFSFYVGESLVGEERFGSPDMNLRYNLLAWTSAGQLFAHGSTPTASEEEWVRGAVVRYDRASKAFDTLVVYDIARAFDPGAVPDPFRPSGRVAADEAALYRVRGDQARLDIYSSDGSPVRTVQWGAQQRALSDSLWAEYVDYGELRGYDGARLGDGARAAVAQPVPEVAEVVADGSGNVWVAEFSPDRWHPRRFWVFSRGGEFRGSVVMPVRTEVLDIRHGLVLAVQRDALGVPTVELLPVEVNARD